MEFINSVVDKKVIQKQDIGLNQFLVENNFSQIQRITEFLQSDIPLLLINGFMGTGKIMVVNQALSFLNEDVVTLKYNCFETTILDDILLQFFDEFKKLTAQNIIQTPKVKPENFTQKINSYFSIIEKPVVIVINSFEQILQENKGQILDFLAHLSKFSNIKTILIARKFNIEDFNQTYEKISISALEKGVFEKYLRAEGFKQIGPLSDELYKQTRGYFFYTTLAIKIMQTRSLTLADFLSGHSKSFLSFNDFILREALALVDPVSGHLFRFLTLMRHPVNVKLLKMLNLYDADRISYFVDNQVLTREGSLIYLQDYYKVIAENSIAENIAIKIHKNCVELYETQLPLKPLERDLLISRQTMRKEIEFHNLFIPKKPVIQTVKPIPNIVQIEPVSLPPPTIKEKEEKIKNISFVFESEENETFIMNKIANSINKFVDISDKKSSALEEIKNLPLVELVNLAKNEEQKFEYLKAVMIYQKALTMNNDDDYYTLLPTLYLKLAEAFKKMTDWFNALKYYELGIEFFLSTGDVQKINECKFEIANIHYTTYKREIAEKLLNEILDENVSVNLKLKAELLLSTLTGSKIKSILPDAISEIDVSVLAEYYFKCGLGFDEDGDFENAIKNYKKCVEVSKDPLTNLYLSSSLANIATILDDNRKPESAIKYLQESIRLDELTSNYNGIYASSMKLSEIYCRNDIEKTLYYLKKAKFCAIQLNESFYIASSSLALGDFYFGIKDYKNALELYNEAYKLAQENLAVENIKKIEMRINDIKKVNNEG